MIAIFGHRGFIGEHLQQALSSRGKQYACYAGDINNSEQLAAFFAEHNISTVVHLAGRFAGDGQTLLDKNVNTTQAVLEQCQLNGVSRVVFTSTGAVYGDPKEPTSQEDSPLHPNTLYGLAKQLAEETVLYYHRNHGIQYAILRYPNVYGPGNRKGVLYAMISRAFQEKSVTLNGDGMQSRHFLHIDDAVEAILLAIDHQGSGIYNITNPNQVFIHEVAEHLHQTLDAEIKHAPLTNGLAHLLLDPTRASEELGFNARITEIQYQQIIDQVKAERESAA